MNTEQDTFNRLRQTPFKQVLDRLGTRLLASESEIGTVLEENYWTYDEYRKQLTKFFQLDQNFNIQL